MGIVVILRYLLIFLFIFRVVLCKQPDPVVNPSVFIFDDKTAQATLNIYNNGDGVGNFELYSSDRVSNNTGSLTNSKYTFSAKEMVIFSPSSFSIPPHGEQLVRVIYRKNNNLTAGEYRTYLNLFYSFVTDDKELPIRKKMYLGIPVIINIGDCYVKNEIKNARLAKVKGKKYLFFDIKRQGNKATIGNIKIKYGNKQEILKKSVVIYRNKNSISLKLPVSKEIAANRNLSVIYVDKKNNLLAESIIRQ